MIRVIHVGSVFICVALQFFVNNPPILLNAQPGWSDDQRLVFLPGDGQYPRAACCRRYCPFSLVSELSFT